VKTSTQLKALVRNLSKAKNVEAEIILRNFMLERFLERVSVSDYKDNFILKGGMLIAAMVGIDTRTTMDMDATIKGKTLSQSEVSAFIENILRIPIDDGVSFTLRGIEEIREEADYPGYRASIEAILDKTRQTLKVDITTGVGQGSGSGTVAKAPDEDKIKVTVSILTYVLVSLFLLCTL
jgi:hypothetical protein